MKKTTLVLDEEELMELERILLDEEKEEALNFLKQIKAKIKASQVRTCGITTQEATQR